jgi:hypothetical protein
VAKPAYKWGELHRYEQLLEGIHHFLDIHLGVVWLCKLRRRHPVVDTLPEDEVVEPELEEGVDIAEIAEVHQATRLFVDVAWLYWLGKGAVLLLALQLLPLLEAETVNTIRVVPTILHP